MKITLLAILLVTTVSSLKAQKRDSVTTEEMNRYVVMMDSVEAMKKMMAETNLVLARGNEKITPARYKKLLPFLNDQKSLTEAKATPDEIAYLEKAMEIRNENTRKFQTAFSSLINDIGEATYNKVKKAVESNPKVKERYIHTLNKLNGNASEKQ